jgi:hypothetical protein
MHLGLHVKYQLIRRILMKHIFSRKIFGKTLKYEVPWEVRPVEAELFNADRRTDSKI